MKKLNELKQKRAELREQLDKLQQQIEEIEPKKVESSGGCTSIDVEL